MGYMARWGPKGFLVSPEKIVPIIELKTALSLDKDTGNLDSQEIELSTSYYKATGVDPRAQWEEWKSLIGESYPFYIGNERFGPKKMKLMGINLSDLLLANSGEFLAVTIGLIFTEYIDPPVTVSSGDTGGTEGTEGTGSTRSDKISTPFIPTKAIIHDGLSATASDEDRVEHAPVVHVSSSGREHGGGSLGYVPLEQFLPSYVQISTPKDGLVTISFHKSYSDPYYVGYAFPNGAVIEHKSIMSSCIYYMVRLP